MKMIRILLALTIGTPALLTAGEILIDAGKIHKAVSVGNFKKVRAFIKKDPDCVHARDAIGNTPLHIAADRGYLEIAKLLVINGADHTAMDLLGRPPYYDALMRNQHEMMLYLEGLEQN